MTREGRIGGRVKMDENLRRPRWLGEAGDVVEEMEEWVEGEETGEKEERGAMREPREIHEEDEGNYKPLVLPNFQLIISIYNA